jgi:hypothetical protein
LVSEYSPAGAAVIKDPSEPVGSNVFVWQDGEATNGSTWEGIAFRAEPSVHMAPNTDVGAHRRRAICDGRDQGAHQARDGAGHHLTATPDTGSGTGFTVMDAPTS